MLQYNPYFLCLRLHKHVKPIMCFPSTVLYNKVFWKKFCYTHVVRHDKLMLWIRFRNKYHFWNALTLHATHVMYYAYMWLSAPTKTSIALMFSSLLNEFSLFPPELSSLLLCGPVCLFRTKGRWFYCGPISCSLDTYKRNIRNPEKLRIPIFPLFPCGYVKVSFQLGVDCWLFQVACWNWSVEDIYIFP